VLSLLEGERYITNCVCRCVGGFTHSRGGDLGERSPKSNVGDGPCIRPSNSLKNRPTVGTN